MTVARVKACRRSARPQRMGDQPSPTPRGLLFLDVDGVLHGASPTSVREYFRPGCMAALRRICTETGCDIVLSSSWREFPEKVKMLRAALDVSGCPQLIGMTPELLFGGRADAIGAWLRSGRNSKRCVGAPFVVLDDMPLPALGAHAILVHPGTGLCEADADTAIQLLNSPAAEPCGSFCARLQERSQPRGRAFGVFGRSRSERAGASMRRASSMVGLDTLEGAKESMPACVDASLELQRLGGRGSPVSRTSTPSPTSSKGSSPSFALWSRRRMRKSPTPAIDPADLAAAKLAAKPGATPTTATVVPGAAQTVVNRNGRAVSSGRRHSWHAGLL